MIDGDCAQTVISTTSRIVTMNKEGKWEVKTNVQFTFVVVTHKYSLKTYVTQVINEK